MRDNEKPCHLELSLALGPAGFVWRMQRLENAAIIVKSDCLYERAALIVIPQNCVMQHETGSRKHAGGTVESHAAVLQLSQQYTAGSMKPTPANVYRHGIFWEW